MHTSTVYVHVHVFLNKQIYSLAFRSTGFFTLKSQQQFADLKTFHHTPSKMFVQAAVGWLALTSNRIFCTNNKNRHGHRALMAMRGATHNA